MTESQPHMFYNENMTLEEYQRILALSNQYQETMAALKEEQQKFLNDQAAFGIEVEAFANYQDEMKKYYESLNQGFQLRAFLKNALRTGCSLLMFGFLVYIGNQYGSQFLKSVGGKLFLPKISPIEAPITPASHIVRHTLLVGVAQVALTCVLSYFGIGRVPAIPVAPLPNPVTIVTNIKEWTPALNKIVELAAEQARGV